MEFKLRGDFIELDNLLKTSGIAQSGADAKLLIRSEKVLVNGLPETKVRRKLYAGDCVFFETQELRLV